MNLDIENLKANVGVLKERIEKVNSRLYIDGYHIRFISMNSECDFISVRGIYSIDVEMLLQGVISDDEWNSIPHELILKIVKEWQLEFGKTEEKATLDELTKLIKKWAVDTDLYKSEPKGQFIKLGEEFGELARALIRKETPKIKDALGDMYVVMTILAYQMDIDIKECVEIAYNIIKDRKGKMIDGIFVKESDLPCD